MTDDFTEELFRWLLGQFSRADIQRVAAGIIIGVAVGVRHPEIAEQAHAALVHDRKIRGAGSLLHYEAASVASGDERTSNEKLADELAEHWKGVLLWAQQ